MGIPQLIERRAGALLAVPLAALALYGCWSIPGLVARWGGSPAGGVLFGGWLLTAAWCLAGTVRVRSPREWAAFATIALAMRLASLALVAGRVSPGDPHSYGELARHLLAGEGIYLDDPAMDARVWAEFPPVYPLLLAAWGAVAGLSGLSVLTLSTLLDGGAAWLIARLGRRLGEARAGAAAAALYLIWPSVVLNAPLAQKESLELLIVLALVHGWLGASERAAWRSVVAIGVPAGLLALTQPGMAALAALFGLAQTGRIGWRGVIVTGASAAAVAALVMLPWWIRNWQVFHAFVPLTSVGGLSLWVGENAEATGNWMPYPESVRHLPELENARRAGALAVEWMRAHPGEVVRLNAAKFVRAVGVGQFPLVRLSAMRPGVVPAVLAALLPLTHGSQVAMLATGAASLWRRRMPVLVWLLLAVVAQLVLFGVWFEFGERHRELLTPFLLLAVAVSVGSPRGWPAIGQGRCACPGSLHTDAVSISRRSGTDRSDGRCADRCKRARGHEPRINPSPSSRAESAAPAR